MRDKKFVSYQLYFAETRKAGTTSSSSGFSRFSEIKLIDNECLLVLYILGSHLQRKIVILYYHIIYNIIT